MTLYLKYLGPGFDSRHLHQLFNNMQKLFENWRKYINEQETPDDLRVDAANSARKIFVLVGPPSIGKSTWIKSNFEKQNMPYVINRDDIVESVAGQYEWAYDDLFMSPPPESNLGERSDKYGEVVKSPEYMTWQPLSYDKVLEANLKVHNLFTQRVGGAPETEQDIVVDMTNMNSAARERALHAIKGSDKEYTKIAVVFEFEGAEQNIKKLATKRAEEARKAGKSKTIPDAAFDRMFSSFEKIDVGEGFDEIISVDNRETIKSLTI